MWRFYKIFVAKRDFPQITTKKRYQKLIIIIRSNRGIFTYYSTNFTVNESRFADFQANLSLYSAQQFNTNKKHKKKHCKKQTFVVLQSKFEAPIFKFCGQDPIEQSVIFKKMFLSEPQFWYSAPCWIHFRKLQMRLPTLEVRSLRHFFREVCMQFLRHLVVVVGLLSSLVSLMKIGGCQTTSSLWRLI